MMLAMQVSNTHPGVKVVAIWEDGSQTTHYFPYANMRTSKQQLKEWCQSAREGAN